MRDTRNILKSRILNYMNWPKTCSYFRPVFNIHGCVEGRPSTAPCLGVSEWSPEGLYDKSVSWIPNTDEILKLVKKKTN